jgi:acyl-CoA thioester hydrolase
MPLIHTRTFRVRFYECDAYGHVNNANYARYMQEAAFDASAAAGYDFARYEALGQYWLVRETDIEYFQPLRYGDTFEVKTWVADFRRVRSRRAYEFRKAGEDDLVARATTDWVYIDDVTGRPVSVPSEMVAAFVPEGISGPPQPRDPFPSVPPPPSGVFKTRRRVIWQDLDTAWHVNNTVYLSYVEDCGMQVLKAFGWPVQRMTREGFAIVVRRHHIQYLQPAVLDDELEVATWAYGMKRATATRHYTIARVSDGAVIARVNSLCVWIDLATGQPIRVPPHFKADFTPNIVA